MEDVMLGKKEFIPITNCTWYVLGAFRLVLICIVYKVHFPKGEESDKEVVQVTMRIDVDASQGDAKGEEKAWWGREC